MLRVWIGLTMLLLHGFGKLKGFTDIAPGFPDPLGIGHTASLALAVSAEALASVLLVLGLVTRLGALMLVVNMSVAFFMAHHGKLAGDHNGEMAFVYLMGYVVLLLAGGGSFSADKALFGKGGKSAKGSSPSQPKKK
ncbi:MAG: DoxX family protein [Limisphaerales bacterium]